MFFFFLWTKCILIAVFTFLDGLKSHYINPLEQTGLKNTSNSLNYLLYYYFLFIYLFF